MKKTSPELFDSLRARLAARPPARIEEPGAVET